MGEGNPPDVGVQLLSDLIVKLGAVIEQSQLNRELLIEIRDLMADKIESDKALAEATDELCGRLEVLSIAASICADVANGKKTVSMADFCHAMVEAERDIFPDDGDDDDDDDEGDVDPADDPVIPGGGHRRV